LRLNPRLGLAVFLQLICLPSALLLIVSAPPILAAAPTGEEQGRQKQQNEPQNFPSAGNTRGDLWAENQGDQIVFNCAYHDGTTEYIVYRATSASGPWAELGRMPDDVARTSGRKIDDTPDARLMDLCYRVEAINGKGVVIRRYEPMCVPKFERK
jgi:hypothetical protein